MYSSLAGRDPYNNEVTIKKRSLVVIAHNLRSTHNVGSLLRTAEGLGVTKVYLTGYTPYPKQPNDPRMPHESTKIDQQIRKTALGAETTQRWEFQNDITDVINQLRTDGYTIAALEQSPQSIDLPNFSSPTKVALVLGREVEGIEADVIKLTDIQLQIPMFGRKESFNVIQAAAMALYHCRFLA